MKQSNPLEQLRDIHLPTEVASYSVAPGWLVLIGILLIASLIFYWHWLRKRKKLSLQPELKAEFDLLKQKAFTTHSAFSLLAIFKRVALVFIPADQIAALKGEDWLHYINRWLDQSCQFSQQEIDWLSQAAWRPELTIAEKDWRRLVDKCEAACLQMHRKLALQSHPETLANTEGQG